MLRTEPVTRDDLDEIGRASLHSMAPLNAAGELIDIVEQGRLHDPADTGYALLLAAEIFERAGDIEAAVTLVSRAVTAYRRYDEGACEYSRAYRSELLYKLGRREEAMAGFTALRQLLTRDTDAISYLTEMLTACGRADLAVRWVTEALHEILDLQSEVQSVGSDPAGNELVAGDEFVAGDELAVVAYTLAQRRRTMRAEVGLDADHLDRLADRLREELYSRLDDPDDAEPDEGAAVLFWPRREFELLLRRWPSLAAVYGRDWDDHRARLERALTMYADAGHTGLTLLTGVVAELADHCARVAGSVDDPGVRQGYVERLAELHHGAPWPPGRDDPCWCGAGCTYKRCCQPRSGP